LLESALTGDLPPDRAELLNRHLEECEACTTALEQMGLIPSRDSDFGLS